MTYIASLFCFAIAAGLLALQIVLGLEYTEGGSFGTQASMIAAMVTLALLPVAISLARRFGASRLAVASLAIALGALLAYSLPATTGRTGEIKEAKANVADDVASWKSEHTENAKQLRWAVPDKNAECAGAPSPLPPNGWPNCRRKTGTVTALQERQAKLEADIKAAGAAGATGDLGSTLWAWALSWLGITAGGIRKSTVLCFAVGLDFAIWALVDVGAHIFGLALAVTRARRGCAEGVGNRSAQANAKLAPRWSDTAGQSDFPLFADHPALLVNSRSDNGDNSDRPAGGTKPDRPDRGPDEGPRKGPPGRTDGLKADVLAYIRRELADGRSVPSNVALVSLFGGKRSTVSDWLREWEADGAIPERRPVGRCKAIVAAD